MSTADKPSAPSVRDVTTQLEHGDASHVQQLFSGKFEQERVAVLNQMRQLYQGDLKSGATASKMTFQAQDYYDPSIGITYNGSSIYSDNLDISNGGLHHTFTVGPDGYKQKAQTEDAPSDRQPIDPNELRKVTTDLENGSPDSLKTALAGRFAEERVRYLQAVLDMNKSDRTANADTPLLSAQYGGPKWQGNEMTVSYDAGGAYFKGFTGWNPHEELGATLDFDTGQTTFSLHPKQE